MNREILLIERFKRFSSFNDRRRLSSSVPFIVPRVVRGGGGRRDEG